MKKLRNWMGAIAAIVLVFAVVLLIPATSIVEQRKASFRPLSEEALRKIAQRPGGVDQSGLPNHDVPATPGIPVAGDAPAEYAKSTEPPSTDRNRPTGLSKTLTREDLLREFRPGTNPLENTYRGLLAEGMKLKESLSWAAGTEDTGLTALRIGQLAMSRGDIDEARAYFRAALEANIRSGDLSLRQSICGELAWAEDDPEVAAALLEASVTVNRPIDEEFMALRLQNALALSILSGSDALAEHYYARWDALEPGGKPIANYLIQPGGSERIESWLQEHHPDFYETATRWDPMEEAVEPERKSIG